jgi:hypothetical protein
LQAEAVVVLKSVVITVETVEYQADLMVNRAPQQIYLEKVAAEEPNQPEVQAESVALVAEIVLVQMEH